MLTIILIGLIIAFLAVAIPLIIAVLSGLVVFAIPLAIDALLIFCLIKLCKKKKKKE